MWVGTAKVEDSVERIDAVMPFIGVMDGTLDDGTLVSTIRFLGASALDFEGKYGRLLSRNGIERGGVEANGRERVLDNEVMPKRNCVVFDDSTPGTRVTVPMKRWQRSSYVKIRVPKANELKAFLAVNPHLLHWTADALIDGSIRAKKVALRGQAHDAWPYIGDKMLDRIIKSGSIAGMQDEVPLSGFDAEAEDEIDDCEGCKARMHAPVRRNTPKPVQIKPGDVAVDIQMFKCKQVGSGATYGTVFVLLWWCLPWYESHGSEKGGFEMTVDKVRIKMLRLQKVDLREGRIFDGQQASKSVHLESEDGEVFDHMYSDYDSVIKNYKTSAALRQANIDQTYSAPNAHNRNPAENYMRIVKEGALAMQALVDAGPHVTKAPS